MKSQTVRLVDVFALGPFMIWAGYRLSKDAGRPLAGLLLAASGAATIAYNARNYVRIYSGRG